MIGFAVVGPKYSVGGEAAAETAEGTSDDPGAPTLEWYFVGEQMVLPWVEVLTRSFRNRSRCA